jgi:hypothetical protein
MKTQYNSFHYHVRNARRLGWVLYYNTILRDFSHGPYGSNGKGPAMLQGEVLIKDFSQAK